MKSKNKNQFEVNNTLEKYNIKTLKRRNDESPWNETLN